MSKRIDFPARISILDKLRNPALIRDEQERRAIEDAREFRDAYLFASDVWDHDQPRAQIIAMKRLENWSDYDFARIGKAEAMLVSRRGIYPVAWNLAGIAATLLICFCSFELVSAWASALRHHFISASTSAWSLLAIALLIAEVQLVIKPWAIFRVAFLRAEK
ncbi:MAG TPA: hypothetical protein VIR56_01970 [Solimonas sp.]